MGVREWFLVVFSYSGGVRVVARSPDRATPADRRSPEPQGDLRSGRAARSGGRAITGVVPSVPARDCSVGGEWRTAIPPEEGRRPERAGAAPSEGGSHEPVADERGGEGHEAGQVAVGG